MSKDRELSEIIVHINRLLRKKKEGRRRILGKVTYLKDFHSATLNNTRNILIWLPPSYNKIRNKRYPVLYMHDGQNIMDPATSYIGKDWRVDEHALSLIKKRRMEEIIIVGINNTEHRIQEYSDSETGNKYLKFIVEELKNFIDHEYRTLPDRMNTSIIGSSLGGLISFLALWKYPNVFSKGACLSSSFYYEEDKALKMVEEYKGEKKDIRIYIDSGEDGKNEAQRMFCALSSHRFTIGEDLDYFYDAGAEHTESAWASRLERPLLFLYGKRVD